MDSSTKKAIDIAEVFIDSCDPFAPLNDLGWIFIKDLKSFGFWISNTQGKIVLRNKAMTFEKVLVDNGTGGVGKQST